MGVLMLVAAFWAISGASQGWNRVWILDRRPAPKRPQFVVMDSQIANDPAMQATKLKAVGPIAQLIEKSEDSGAIAAGDTSSGDAAPSTTSSSAPSGTHQRYVPNTQKSVRLCGGKLTFSKRRAFAFRVPANVSFPKLEGEFTSLSNDGSPQSIELLVLDQQQYSDFLHGNSVDSMLSNEGSSAQIDFALSPTVDEPRQYYLVLQNPSGGPITLNAKFVVTFD